MKKILLILLCVPLIGLGQENKNCNSKPDYFMTAQDFVSTIENEKDNKKYDGKVFQFSFDHFRDRNSHSIGQDFAYLSYHAGEKNNPHSRKISFSFKEWSNVEYEHFYKIIDAGKKKGFNGGFFTIKGTYSYEKSELEKDNYREGEYKFINCCLVIPNKNNNNTSSKKIDNNKEEIEEEIYGVINDPDGYTNVREDKSSKSEIVFKVYKNKRFKIIDNSGNWWLIEYNGEQGYMYKNRIDVIK